MSRPRPAARADRDRSGFLAPSVAALVVVLIGVFVAVAVRRSNDALQATADRGRVDDAVTLIDNRMASYVDLLIAVRAHLNDVGLDEPAAFGEFVRDLEIPERHPGVQMVGAAAVVDVASADDLLADHRSRLADLGYRELTIHPSPSEDVAVPVIMLEPVAGNEPALGFDLASEELRAATMFRARDTGRVAATPPLRLVQETGSQLGVLVMAPIYEGGAVPAALDARRRQFTGVVVAAFRIGDLMQGVLGPRAGSDDLEVFDAGIAAAGAGPQQAVLMYPAAVGTSTLGTATEATAPPSRRTGSLSVGDRTWLVHVAPATDALSAFQQARPVVIGVVTLVLAALVAAVVRATRSARRYAERLAAARSSELDALSAAASDAIVTVDVEGRIVGWNAAAQRTFGYEGVDVVGKPMTMLLPEEDVERYSQRFFDLVHGLTVPELAPLVEHRTIELTGVHRDGHRFPVELSLAAWTADADDFYTAFLRDVSDRRAAEARLLATTELLSTVFGSVGAGLIATDEHGTVIAFNRGAEQLLGVAATDVIGRATPERFHDVDEVRGRAAELGIEPGFEVFVGAARRGEAETRRWTYVRADGRRVPVELTVTALRGTGGEVRGFLGVAVDLTERLETERVQDAALARERELVASLRELDAAKAEFVSTVSHELRTPLTSIVGFTELLVDSLPADDDEHRSMLATIERNARRLVTLVDDLLTVSRMEAGRFDVEQLPVDLPAAVRAAGESVRPMLGDRTLRLDVDDPVPPVRGDKVQLERVVLNLLSNAIKATPPDGMITVTVGATDADDGDVRLVVADTGMGIPSAEIGELFTRFGRTSNARRHAVQGTGLGLVIVRSIVEAHGGSIAVDSEEGHGATFTVRLPRAAVEPLGASGPEATTAVTARISEEIPS